MACLAGVEPASLDPFCGYAKAIHDELTDAIAALEAFHVVNLGAQVVDEVRRRALRDPLGWRGRGWSALQDLQAAAAACEHLWDK